MTAPHRDRSRDTVVAFWLILFIGGIAGSMILYTAYNLTNP